MIIFVSHVPLSKKHHLVIGSSTPKSVPGRNYRRKNGWHLKKKVLFKNTFRFQFSKEWMHRNYYLKVNINRPVKERNKQEIIL